MRKIHSFKYKTNFFLEKQKLDTAKKIFFNESIENNRLKREATAAYRNEKLSLLSKVMSMLVKICKEDK